MTDLKPRNTAESTWARVDPDVLERMRIRREADQVAEFRRQAGMAFGNNFLPDRPVTPPWTERLPWHARLWLRGHGWLTPRRRAEQ